MGLQKRFLPHSAYLKTGAIDSWINGIESINPENGIALLEETAGSETDREFVAVRDVSPTLPIVTSDVSLLATIGLAGLAIVPASGKPGLTMFGRELPLGALPTAIGTGNHISMAVSDGVIIPVSVNASHNQAAKLHLLLHAILGSTAYSGASPFVFTNSQTITAGAGQTANIYTTGAIKWTSGGDKLVYGISDITVDFGLQVLKESADGQVYPDMVGIVARHPTIRFSTKDATLANTVGDGIAVTAFTAYFRQVAASGQRVAPATATHISIAGTAGIVTPANLNMQHRQGAAMHFTYTPVKNTNILTISTTAAIPTS